MYDPRFQQSYSFFLVPLPIFMKHVVSRCGCKTQCPWLGSFQVTWSRSQKPVNINLEVFSQRICTPNITNVHCTDEKTWQTTVCGHTDRQTVIPITICPWLFQDRSLKNVKKCRILWFTLSSELPSKVSHYSFTVCSQNCTWRVMFYIM